MRKRRRSFGYKFTERTHSAKGIAGLILAIASILIGIVLVMISFRSNGNGALYLGGGGLMAFLLALTAFFLAWTGIQEENSYRVFPIAAMVVSLLSLIGWFAVYIIGLF